MNWLKEYYRGFYTANKNNSIIKFENKKNKLVSFCNNISKYTNTNKNTVTNANDYCANKPKPEYIISSDKPEEGLSNLVYNIENHADKVFRITKNNEPADVEMELNGLYLQWYLSNECLSNYICKVYDFGYITDNRVGAILEKLVPLDVYIYDNKSDIDLSDKTKYYIPPNNIPNDTIVKILYDILKGLQCIHEQKYIHLDIKIENVGLLIENDEIKTAKIFDFGNTYYIDNKPYEKIFPVGTDGYIDPILEFLNVRCKSNDIFSFGFLVYYLVIENKKKPLYDGILELVKKCIYPVNISNIKNYNYLFSPIEKYTTESINEIINSRGTVDELLELPIFASFHKTDAQPVTINSDGGRKIKNSKKKKRKYKSKTHRVPILKKRN